MSLQFLNICQLFEQLSSLRDLESRESSVHQWFEQHQNHIRRRGPPALALLSCLFPEKRADRVYALRTQQLEHMVTKTACLGHARVSELRRLQGRDRMDFASAVQQVLSATDDFSNPSRPLTVDEVDHALDRLASTCVFSSPKLRESITIGYTEVFDELVRVLRRLPSVGVKWMIRLLLKSLGPVEIPVATALRAFHFLMPDLLKVRTSLAGAIELLEGDTISHLPVSPPHSIERPLKESARAEIEPRLGMMIGLQDFEKARSIQHCCQLAGRKEIHVERKYDGEYCQIHVSRTNSQHHITIFSKSGRDSTMDRVGVHDAIRGCLGLGTSSCRFRDQCVLVGELLVWNDQMGQIMPFYKIRRYVTREGRRLGCARDSPPSEDEHLMIMFYDMLLLDNILCLHEPLHLRRRRLETLISRKTGQAEIGEGIQIDSRHSSSVSRFHDEMTSAIAKGWEGLVIKDWNAPYMSLHGDVHQIKLKKDYIPGWGDSADMVIVGGRCDATAALMMGDIDLSWTTFYLACPTRKDVGFSSETKPTFRVVGTVSRPCLAVADLRYLNEYGRLCQVPFAQSVSGIHIEISPKSFQLPTELFTKPAVVEVVGAGFDRLRNERFFTLRFPRIQKIHHDRTYADSLDFDEYQRLAKQSVGHLNDGGHQHGKGRLPEELAILETIRPTGGLASSDISRGGLRGFDSGINPESISRNHLIANGNTLHALTKKRKRSEGSGLTSSVLQKMRKTTVAEEPNKDRNTTSSPSAAPSALHLARGQYMRDCGTPTPHDQSISAPREDPSRAVVPDIPVPLLCDTSLWDLFHDSAVDVAAACWKSPLEITSRKEVFLDGVTGRMTNKAGWRGHALIPHIVLVNWSSTSDVLNGIQSWLSVLQGHESLLSRPGSWEISFLNWNALEAFGDLSQHTPHIVDSFSHGSIVCRD
ncbi:hypothetical protein LTR47_011506 [Exophiala xenobiotica]|nr:hypothetical protein LTR47_011506 [Exophiala xenobiotica]KAK5243797.1 hypothetical protein LTS06_010508 [Exophiala xenobiotica]KAK5283061.1 hypothetical protein LTR40_002338 [Exophiala xenobiotica]KAK5357284.1 hypothetical protein LTR11_011495 [Exophiala xenobiotica]KAK5357678.1 hypothetical protein LTS03_011496 [Exophiala xenobiotica]